MNSERKLSNSIVAKAVRACDNCIKKRAKWYCAADDAFLCQTCDSSVHSANTLARRHERVCLKIAPIKSLDAKVRIFAPSWHKGFKRKARTPRKKKKNSKLSFCYDPVSRNQNPLHLVPEICSEEHSHEENEEQLLYRVPIFDPFVAELWNSNKVENCNVKACYGIESESLSNDFGKEMKRLQGSFLPSEADLAEFAADVQSLLGKELDDELFDMEGLGLLDCNVNENKCSSLGIEKIKVEDEEDNGEAITREENNDEDDVFDLGRETFELNFDYDSPLTCEQEDDKSHLELLLHATSLNNTCNYKLEYSKKKNLLFLDYEGVLTSWDGGKSPWTTGERPVIDFRHCLPDNTGESFGKMHAYGEMVMIHGHGGAVADVGREARVTRYREKRRTRLFSKKIRYEVRKLNAEKRPRMKGRFVKRVNLVSAANP